MTIAVIGRGLIGAAAARHLAVAGQDVVLIGPEEPADKASHTGVFASHYDEGRITRALDPSPFWSRASRASIARYAEIEAASGIRFFSPVGSVVSGPEGGSFMRDVRAVAAAESISCDAPDAAERAGQFSYFAFPDGTDLLHEPMGAGYVSPRRLVAAQTEAAKRAGAQLIGAEVTGLHDTGAGIRVHHADGQLDTDQTLVAAGGFTNALLPNPLPINVYARTVALFELGADEAARLAGMPTLIKILADGRDLYLLPPIRYPDGKTYLKLGGDPVDVPLEDSETAKAWFRGQGDPQVVDYLASELQQIVPGLRAKSVSGIACVTTFTARDRPIIARLDDRLSVATAGHGKGAKCSDELGRLAAEAVMGRCDPELGV